jgi:hypothetical protein
LEKIEKTTQGTEWIISLCTDVLSNASPAYYNWQIMDYGSLPNADCFFIVCVAFAWMCYCW